MNSNTRGLLVVLIVVGIFLPPRTSCAQMLQASVSLDLSHKPVWNYTITNLEPTGSPNWVAGFLLPIAAPIENVLTPEGWAVETDFATFVLWSNVEDPPFPHEIPPGGSLSGFQFESEASGQTVDYEIASWDVAKDDVGPKATGKILAPGVAGPGVPEPGALVLLSAGVLGALPLLRRRAARP